MAEPELKIERPPARSSQARVLALGLVGLIVLALTPVVDWSTASPPTPAITEIKGMMASKRDFFNDARVKEILLSKRIRVIVDTTGSREIFFSNLDKYDFVFPSGQPAAEMVQSKRLSGNKEFHTYLPFVSPIVLATYRPYALALQDAGVATPMNRGTSNPLYYEIDLKKFIGLSEQGKRWSDIGVRNYGIQNDNLVLAHTPDVCWANSAGTYQGMIAYTKNGGRVASDEREVAALARSLRPLYLAQGATTADRVPYYLAPEGVRIAPVVVIYEHQYLTYQLERSNRGVDDHRVLLYPADHFESQPSLIALNDTGRKLGELLQSDPELRRRAVELGFRALDANKGAASPLLTDLLAERGIEAPPLSNDHTRAYLPQLDLYEQLVTTIGNCR